MANDIIPISSLFRTSNMIPEPGEDGDSVQVGYIAENTGHLYRGGAFKWWEVFGSISVNMGNGSTTTVSFASDGIDGVTTFSSTNYHVELTLADDPNNMTGYDGTVTPMLEVKNRGLTSFQIEAHHNGSLTGNLTYIWKAMGR